MKNWLNTQEVELGFESKWQEDDFISYLNIKTRFCQDKVRLNMLCF